MINQDALNILGWSSDDLSSLQFIAYSYIRQGKYHTAQTLLETLYVLDPSNLYTLSTLGACYIETKNPYKALDVIEKALKLEPASDVTLYNRVQALLSLGLKKQAIADCETLLKSQDVFIKSKAEAILLSEALA